MFFNNPLFGILVDVAEKTIKDQIDDQAKKAQAEAQAKVAQYVFEHTPVGSFTKSFVDNVIKDKVVPIPGSILHCSLWGPEHTGIYIGNDEIVELLGSGEIRKTNASGFMEGTNAISIYVACNKTEPLGSVEIAQRAKNKIGTKRNYNLIMDNCHQFTAGCILNDYENSTNFFTLLESIIENKMNYGRIIEWRVWDI